MRRSVCTPRANFFPNASRELSVRPVRILVAFASSVLFGWGFMTLVLTRPEAVPHLAILLAVVMTIEYWLTNRDAKRRPEALSAPGSATMSGAKDG